MSLLMLTDVSAAVAVELLRLARLSGSCFGCGVESASKCTAHSPHYALLFDLLLLLLFSYKKILVFYLLLLIIQNIFRSHIIYISNAVYKSYTLLLLLISITYTHIHKFL